MGREEEKPLLDLGLGGRLRVHPDSPQDYLDLANTEQGQTYLGRVDQFYQIMENNLPEGYFVTNFADPGSAWRKLKEGQDPKKTAHPRKLAHDFSLRHISDPDKPLPWDQKDLWEIAENQMAIGQYLGVPAKGGKHGSGPHVHFQEGNTGADITDMDEYLEKIWGVIRRNDESIGRSPVTERLEREREEDQQLAALGYPSQRQLPGQWMGGLVGRTRYK